MFLGHPVRPRLWRRGDAEHGVVDAVAFQAAIAQDLPALHPDADVFDAGMDCAVRGVACCFSHA